MPSLSRSTPQQQVEPAPPAVMPGPASTGPGATGAGAGAARVRRGGTTYVVKRGDTLWDIARDTYGSGRHWRAIMDANPGKVGRGGDLIVVGVELILPIVRVDAPTPGTPAVDGPGGDTDGDRDGGTQIAIVPYGTCTEFGDFLVFPNDFVGPLPPTGEDGVESVRASDIDQIVADRRTAAEAQRTAAVSSVRDLLSYDWNDWAITDAEATHALNLLGGLHITQIGPALSSLGQQNIDRLLDNLPDSARRSAGFTKVIVALGPARAAPWIQDLLSYGIFDWAITDADVTAICDVIARLPQAQQAAFVLQLDVAFQVRFATNLPQAADIDDATLKQLFDAMPDAQVAALAALLGVRFNFDVSGRDGGSWTAAGLRQAWVLLAQLPPGHVEDNDLLDMFLQGGSSDGSGYYMSSDDSTVVEYSDLNNVGSYGQIMVDDGTGTMVDVGLHSSVNTFNTVVRHEIGHAVDAKIGASQPGGYVATQANAGQWEQYGGNDAFADAIIAAGGGMNGHGYADDAAYEQALRRAIDDEVDFNDALDGLRSEWFGGVDDDVPDAEANVSGPVAAVRLLDDWHPSKSPWYKASGRPSVGGRCFQQAYPGSSWCSFLSAARVGHGVSGYQFRAPGEWFAEAYACYYSDHPDVNGQQVGTALRTRDTQTATWFDANVDGGYSLPAQTNQAPGGGAGGEGGGVGGAPGVSPGASAPAG